LAIYVPLTTHGRQSRYEVPIPKLGFLNAASVANVQGIASVPVVRLERKLGKLPESVVEQILKALRFALDLG
jgi:mRNA interferase MazF